MRFVAVDGVQLAYNVLGTGKPIVVLHDFGDSADFWLECGVAKACLAQGRQVVLVHLRGHGDSSSPVDPNAYGAIDCSQDAIAVLDHAGIDRADFLGYGWGGRIALAVAASSPCRVDAVAAGGCHPFAECMQVSEVLAEGSELRFSLPEASAGELNNGVANRLISIPARAPATAVQCDQPDIADAVVRSSVPILLFVGKEHPRCPLVLSFAERSRARIILVPEHDHESAATAVGDAQLLPRILQFFSAPEPKMDAEPLPLCLWSGAWA